MTFFKLCKYDLKNGMFKEGIKYLALMVRSLSKFRCFDKKWLFGGKKDEA